MSNGLTIYNLGLRFAEIAALYKTKPALVFGLADVMTYGDLYVRSIRLSNLLIEQGLFQHDVLAITGEKIPETFSLMLACLNLGIPYVILDPDSPAPRLARILSKCQPTCVFYDEHLKATIEEATQDLELLLLSKTGNRVQEALSNASHDSWDDNFDLRKNVTGSNPAYVMFTSGSTGFPKGAVIAHHNVLNLISWSQAAFGFGPDEVLTNVNPLYFDNSVFDFYSAIFTGAALAPFSKNEVQDPGCLVAGLDERGCTSWFSVPTLLIFLEAMRAFQPDNFRTVKRFIFGGEGYPLGRLEKLFQAYGERSELINVSGPTECTCICSAYKITGEDFSDLNGFPPLGDTIPNFSYLILDNDLTKTPNGEYGELCLLGPQVGLGYLNDHELTQKAFIQNPYNDRYPEIVYRTGDLVKRDPVDGKIYISGRKDNQIKHKGYRIELEDIENALCSIDGVYQAAVVHGLRQNLSCIAAAVQSEPGLDEDDLRRCLIRNLPNYMVPTEFHFLEDLPKNQNGKLDRKGMKEAVFCQHEKNGT